MPFAKSCARAVHTPLVLSCGSDPGQYHSIKTIELTNGTRHPIQISRRCACDREFTMLRLETERQYTQGSERAGEMRPGGFEPPTNSLEGCCSIHLSYGRAIALQQLPAPCCVALPNSATNSAKLNTALRRCAGRR